jgi:translocator protein
MIKSWMVIGGVTILAALLITRFMTPRGIKWFKRLRRPDWLTFEAAILIIWTTIFICGAWSATLVWETLGNTQAGRSPAWLLMGGYLLVELITLAYSPVMMNLQSLRIGTAIGATGGVFALLLAIAVWQVSQTAAWLLVPYLLWSPIGTYTTWAMAQINPQDA